MKKKKWLLPIGIIAGVALVLALVVLLVLPNIPGNTVGISTGRYLYCDNGSHMIIIDNSPIKMSTDNKTLFEDLSNGDQILIRHDGIQESYPGGTKVYSLIKQAEGDISDIPQTVLDSLTELGWWNGADVQPGGWIDPEDTFDIRLVHANYHHSTRLNAAALNSNKLTDDNTLHLPILKLENIQELQQFKTDYANEFVMDSDYAEVPSFNTATGHMDEAFFEENTVFLVYVPANSGSYRYGVESIDCDGNALTIHVQQTNNPEAVTMDLAGWFVLVALPTGMVEDCTAFDADLKTP